MRYYLTFTIAFTFCICLQAQPDECAQPTNKKVIKLIEESYNPKLDYRERQLKLREALKIDPNCAECEYQLALRAYKKAEKETGDYKFAEEHFRALINMCPKYHSDPYYYLGVLHYGRKEFEEALDMFKQFIAFKSTDTYAFAKDYAEKIRDSKDIIPELEFRINFYKNPVPFNPQVLINVSTEHDEFLPMISPDNEILFYTQRSEKKGMGDLTGKIIDEFMMANRADIDQPFSAGKALSKPFNVHSSYGGITISVDNREIIICACVKDNPKYPDYNNCDLYSSKYERIKNMNTGQWEYKWSDLQKLPPTINTPNGWEAQPSLSADGKTLYFATVRAETRGYDIFYATRDANGNWSAAKPVPGINTDANEKSPFIHSDSKTLYFAASSTEERFGAGNYDIFFTKQQADGKWSKPKNLGYPINTEEDEHGLIVSTDGYYAYFASNRLKGSRGFDIYRFELPREARPEKVVIVKGEIKDEKGEPLKGARIEIQYTDNKSKEEITVNNDDGKYAAVVNLEKGEDAIVTVKKDGYTFDSKVIAANTDKPVVKDIDLKTEPIEVGKAYTINDILFTTNSYELNAKSKFVIDRFIEFLNENPQITIAIHGHTDDVGRENDNLILSENRAKAVKDYIISKGINSSRITSQGFGQSKPKVPNTNDFNRALNRRTEFVITGI
jgi:outer membrane protein OmpA-like peptidoglycan-associated protein/tetratricopeptide (TPR) repeat protein